MRVIGRDDVYPVKTFKVSLLHYFIATALIRLWNSAGVLKTVVAATDVCHWSG